MTPGRADESGVSGAIGSIFLIVVVVAGMAILMVAVVSQPHPQNVPAMTANVTWNGNGLYLTHEGGNTLQSGEFQILVDGQNKTSAFNVQSAWSIGQTLTYSGKDYDPQNPPGTIQIVYTGGGAGQTIEQVWIKTPTLTMTATTTTPQPTPVPAPVAGFTASPLSGSAPLTVLFSDTSTNSPTAWSWNFGDGDSTNSTVQNPVHRYANPGTYSVSLTATNSAGSNTSTKTGYISVTALPPVAGFTGAPRSGTAPLTVLFSDTSTNSPTTWLWNFGDGTTSTGQNPSHTYTAAGTYTVSLTATNSAGSNTSTKTGYISVTALPPVAGFTGTPRSGTVPLTVLFNDTSSNSPTTWLWNFGDGTTSTGQNPSHTYTATGTYTVSLTATNSAGSNTASQSNYITATLPPLTADFTYDSSRFLIWHFVYFTDTSTGNPAPNSWQWNFGDGGTSAVQNPSYTYWSLGSGTYVVTLTVKNSAGQSSTVTKTITV